MLLEIFFSNLTVFGHLLFHSALARILKAATLYVSPEGIHIVRFSSWPDWVTSSDTQKNKNKCKIIIQTKELQ